MFTLFAHRIALGRLFQSFGAAHVNERSPRVVKLLNAGYFNKSVSELVLRLYLPGLYLPGYSPMIVLSMLVIGPIFLN